MSTRTAESIAKIARKNPVSARTWWIAGLAGAAAAGVGVIAYIVTRPGTSLQVGPVTATQLTPGHRYGLTLACPSALPAPLPTDNTSAAAWLGIPNVTVVSFKQTSPSSVAVMFDYQGTVVLPMPPIQSSGATACTTQLSDMGPSPQA
jgi:hypothetical protein